MWMILLNSGWQPADTDAIVIAWIQQGLVGPNTQIRHSSWPAPSLAASIPQFQAYFVHAMARGPGVPMQPVAPSKAPKIIGALVAAIALAALSQGATLGAPAVGVLIFLLTTAAIAAVISFSFVAAAPPALRRVGGVLRKWPVAAAVAFLAPPLGAANGFKLRASKVRFCEETVEAASKAQQSGATFSGPDPAGDLKYQQDLIAIGRGACETIHRDADTKRLDDASAALAKQASAAIADVGKKAEVAKAAAEKAAQEKREKDAVAAFATDSKTIADDLKSASTEAASWKWEAAETKLNAARDALAKSIGTSVQETAPWKALSTQQADQRRKIQPQLDTLAAARKKKDEDAAKKEAEVSAAAAAIVAVRGTKPVNSGWDGSVSCVESYLKRVMNDPGSYEHVSSSAPVAIGDYWVVQSSFRGKNGFGALIVSTKQFYIQQLTVVKVADVD